MSTRRFTDDLPEEDAAPITEAVSSVRQISFIDTDGQCGRIRCDLEYGVRYLSVLLFAVTRADYIQPVADLK